MKRVFNGAGQEIGHMQCIVCDAVQGSHPGGGCCCRCCRSGETGEVCNFGGVTPMVTVSAMEGELRI